MLHGPTATSDACTISTSTTGDGRCATWSSTPGTGCRAGGCCFRQPPCVYRTGLITRSSRRSAASRSGAVPASTATRRSGFGRSPCPANATRCRTTGRSEGSSGLRPRARCTMRPCQAPAAARSATAAWRSAPQEHALDPRLRRQGHQRRRRPRRGLSDRRRLLGSLRPRRQCASPTAGETRSRPVGVDRLGELDRAHRSRRPSDRAHPGRAELRSVTAGHGVRRDAAEGVLRSPDTPPTRPDDLLAPSTLPANAGSSPAPSGRIPGTATTASESASRFASPESSTPKHLGADGPGVGAEYSPCPAPGILELGLANVRGLETLGAACHLELHLVTFRQTLEALRGDGAEVDEDVLAALLRDEAEALRIVEPLDSTVCHT